MLHRISKHKIKLILLLSVLLLLSSCSFLRFYGIENLLANPEEVISTNETFQSETKIHCSFNGNFNNSSTNGISLTEYGIVNFGSDREGTVNSAAHFHGEVWNNYIMQIIEPLNSFSYTDAITISLWINLSDVMTDQVIISQYDSVAFTGHYLGIKNGTCYSLFSGVSTFDFISFNETTIPVTINNWHHIGLTWKAGGKIRIYIDGVLDFEKNAVSGAINNANFRYFVIGNDVMSAYDYPVLDGSIDDVRIYNTELTAEKILNLATAPAD